MFHVIAQNPCYFLTNVDDITFSFHLCRDFCTATRNYAKRQLNWYRKDKNFLFVRSRRHFVKNKALADEMTAEEVQHWATVPRREFDQAVSQQLAISEALTELRKRLEREIQVQTGESFDIFQDRKDIRWGQAWKERINDALDGSTFLIAIVTPGYLKSPACREEFERFREREKKLKRNDPISF